MPKSLPSFQSTKIPRLDSTNRGANKHRRKKRVLAKEYQQNLRHFQSLETGLNSHNLYINYNIIFYIKRPRLMDRYGIK